MKCSKYQLVNPEVGPASGIMKMKNHRLRVCPNHSTTYTPLARPVTINLGLPSSQGVRGIVRDMKRLLLLFLLIQVISLCLSAEPASGSGKWAFGIYAGWSSGLGWDFNWHYRSSISDKTTLGAHLGAYTRYEISDTFGIQLDANYQAGLNEWTFRYWGWPEEQGEDRFGIASLSLQGVLHLIHIGRFRGYGLGGGGVSSGAWGEYGGFSELYYHLVGGLGVRFGLLSSRARPALSLGGTFHHLMDPAGGSTRAADYVRLNLGLEF